MIDLESIAARIDRVEDEKAAAMADLREIYKEAKGDGYNTVALRKVIAERRKPTDAALLADIEAYRAALGVEGATYRSVAGQFGVSKSKLHRLVPQVSRGTDVGREMVADDLGEWLPDHDPETGELPREMTAEDLGDPLLVIDPPRAVFREKVRVIAAKVKAPERVDLPTINDEKAWAAVDAAREKWNELAKARRAAR